MTTQQDREELIRWIEQESLDHEYGSYAQEMLRKAADLLAEDGQAGGEAAGRLDALIEHFTAKWGKDNVAVQDLVFVRTALAQQAAQVAQSLTDEQWQEIADITGSIITRRDKDAIEKVLGIGKDQP